MCSMAKSEIEKVVEATVEINFFKDSIEVTPQIKGCDLGAS